MIFLYAKQIDILAYLPFPVTVGVKLMQCSTRSANTLYISTLYLILSCLISSEPTSCAQPVCRDAWTLDWKHTLLASKILIRIALSDQEASFEELSSEHGARNYGCRAAQRCAEITCDINDSSAEWEFA